uniref:Abnormal cell migration protein 18-like fibronectin type I domain-containing protein n=1 Tax=Plectus sambesii TaxID=2011161 RepID=A0A914VDA0_9BILA
MGKICVFAIVLIFAATSLACKFNGNTFKDKDTWIENGAFVMECKMEPTGAWQALVIGCKSPNGTTIPSGESLVEDGFEYACDRNAEGATNLRRRVPEKANCRSHKFGEVWTENQFEYTCFEHGNFRITACFTDKQTRIAINSSVIEDQYVMRCLDLGNGLHQLRGEIHNKAFCIDQNGVKHEHGTSWTEDTHFNRTCTEGGKVVISNCISSSNKSVAIGEQFVEGSIIQKCRAQPNGTVWFQSEAHRKSDRRRVVNAQLVLTCTDSDGSLHKVGESWIAEQNFNKTCNPDGSVKISNCVLESVEIALDTKINRNGKTYRCETAKGAVFFRAEFISLNLDDKNDVAAAKSKDNFEVVNSIEQTPPCMGHQPASEWTFGSLRLRCDAKSESEVIGCVSEDGDIVPKKEYYASTAGVLYLCEVPDDGLSGQLIRKGCFNATSGASANDVRTHIAKYRTWFKNDNLELRCLDEGVRLFRCHFNTDSGPQRIAAGGWLKSANTLHVCGTDSGQPAYAALPSPFDANQ